jgi:hypothetical protein
MRGWHDSTGVPHCGTSCMRECSNRWGTAGCRCELLYCLCWFVLCGRSGTRILDFLNLVCCRHAAGVTTTYYVTIHVPSMLHACTVFTTEQPCHHTQLLAFVCALTCAATHAALFCRRLVTGWQQLRPSSLLHSIGWQRATRLPWAARQQQRRQGPSQQRHSWRSAGGGACSRISQAAASAARRG